MTQPRTWTNLFYGAFIVAIGLRMVGLETWVGAVAVAIAASWATWRDSGGSIRGLVRTAAYGACAVMALTGGAWPAAAIALCGLGVSLAPFKHLDRSSARPGAAAIALLPVLTCMVTFAMGTQ